DEDLKLGSIRSLTIQLGTVFKNHGPISGDITGQWKTTDPQKSRNAAIITVEDVTLTRDKRCAETPVQMYVDNILNKETTAKASDKDYWSIDDNIEYVAGRKPPIELGKLIDDMAVLGNRPLSVFSVMRPFNNS
ncbi:MAG: hypothetical protein AB7V46_18735, partial [Thermomicrobiales bacterium]